MDPKTLQKYTRELSVLLVDDDTALMEQLSEFFSLYFAKVDKALDGEEGLQKYHNSFPDVVVTDISMPRMDGVTMSKAIRKTSAEQAIIVLSAHDDSHFLLPLIEINVDAFMPKPFRSQQAHEVLFRVCRGIYEHRIFQKTFDRNLDLIAQLQKKVEELQHAANSLEVKHAQIAQLTRKKLSKKEPEPPEEEPAVVIMDDHVDEIRDRMTEIGNLIPALCHMKSDPRKRQDLFNAVQVIASILLFYSPYIDKLGAAFIELKNILEEHVDKLPENEIKIIKLFDSLGYDMERYVQVFSKEGVTGENAHRLHNPTVASLEQIIGALGGVPDDGDVEFF